MELELDLRKTVRQNLQDRYAQLRKLKEKKAGLVQAIEQTRQEMERLQKGGKGDRDPPGAGRPSSKGKTRSGRAKTYWYDAYHTFLTSEGRRVVAGGDAKQNDELYAKCLMTGDLFFHADIQGAPTTILKDGQKAGEAERREVAQFAAAFSSAWKTGASAVDVYAVKPDQVGKNAVGGYVGRGAFVIEGERQWFRDTALMLRIGWMADGKSGGAPRPGAEGLGVLPACHPAALQKPILLTPGPMPKEEAAKLLAGKLGAKADTIAAMLPSGKFSIRE